MSNQSTMKSRNVDVRAAIAAGRVLKERTGKTANEGPDAIVTFEQLREWGYPIENGLRCHCSRCHGETATKRGR